MELCICVWELDSDNVKSWDCPSFHPGLLRPAAYRSRLGPRDCSGCCAEVGPRSGRRPGPPSPLSTGMDRNASTSSPTTPTECIMMVSIKGSLQLIHKKSSVPVTNLPSAAGLDPNIAESAEVWAEPQLLYLGLARSEYILIVHVGASARHLLPAAVRVSFPQTLRLALSLECTVYVLVNENCCVLKSNQPASPGLSLPSPIASAACVARWSPSEPSPARAGLAAALSSLSAASARIEDLKTNGQAQRCRIFIDHISIDKWSIETEPAAAEYHLH